MADTLRTLGFQVIFRRNADQNSMKRAIQEFGGSLEKGGPALETLMKTLPYAGNSADYQAFLKSNNIGNTWYGPEKSTAMILENFEVVKKYQGELKT